MWNLTFNLLFFFPVRRFLLEPRGAAEPFSLSRAGEHVMLPVSGPDVECEGGDGGRF